MTLGYTDPLMILAFDHRGSFQSKLMGIAGTPTAEDTARVIAAKRVIFEGFERALAAGADRRRRRAGRRAVRRGRRPRRPRARHPVRDAGREERPGRVRLRVRRAVRRPHPRVLPHVREGARPLQPGRRPGDERPPGGAARPAVALAARRRPQVPVRAAGARRARAARGGRRRRRPLRPRGAAGADDRGDRRAACGGHRARHLEDRGPGRARGLRARRRRRPAPAAATR